jgi:hypothetical protein
MNNSEVQDILDSVELALRHSLADTDLTDEEAAGIIVETVYTVSDAIDNNMEVDSDE